MVFSGSACEISALFMPFYEPSSNESLEYKHSSVFYWSWMKEFTFTPNFGNVYVLPIIGCVDMCMAYTVQPNYWLFTLVNVVQFSQRSLVLRRSVTQTRWSLMSSPKTSVLSEAEQSRTLMEVELIWCADFPPVSQPRRQLSSFLRVFFSAAMICGCVAKTNRTNCSTQ